MRLIEKKCPKCNASLEFKATDTEVTCKYCRSSFIIEKDNDFNLSGLNNLSSDAYNLVMNNYKQIMGGSKVVFVIAGVFIMAIAITMFVGIVNSHRIFNSRSNSAISNKKNESLSKLGYIEKYSDIDETFIIDLRTGGINALDNKINFYVDSFMPKIVKTWNYKGSYFLTNKDESSSGNQNILYDVYEIILSIDNKNVSYYGVVINSNFKKVDNKVVTLNNTYVEAPRNELKNNKVAFGYISLNSVFNDLVSKKADTYNIEKIGIED